jgi:hypothetical protein
VILLLKQAFGIDVILIRISNPLELIRDSHKGPMIDINTQDSVASQNEGVNIAHRIYAPMLSSKEFDTISP